jgi:hypothetical protein
MRRDIPCSRHQNRARYGVKDPDPVLDDSRERYPHQAGQDPDRQRQ